MTERRRFITKASGVMAAMAATAMVDAPYVIAEPKVQWRLSTTWPKQLDNLQGAAQRLAQVVEEMSGGRFRIEVFPGASSYWSATEPATDWFISIPFGIDPQGMTVWYYHGDGLKLWEETYAPFNLVPRLGPGFAPQMGGWFRKKINTLADYKGLKMRIAGLGSRVIAKAGATPVLTPAAEIYAAFERA